MNQQVRRVDQSPMNAQRWCLELVCGHEVWLTAKSRPARKTVRCPRCSEKESSGIRGTDDQEMPRLR